MIDDRWSIKKERMKIVSLLTSLSLLETNSLASPRIIEILTELLRLEPIRVLISSLFVDGHNRQIFDLDLDLDLGLDLDGAHRSDATSLTKRRPLEPHAAIKVCDPLTDSAIVWKA